MTHSAQEIEEMERERAAFTKSVEITEKAIIHRGKELKEFVDKCTWSLLEELTTIKYHESKAMESENELLGSHILHGTDFQSTFPYDGLHESFVQTQQPPKTPTTHFPSIRISFEISKLEDFLQGNNIVGKIKSMCLSRKTSRTCTEADPGGQIRPWTPSSLAIDFGPPIKKLT